ncbi:hypothetical protein INT43_008868 [Umbelopsis isabellina]|uniref:Uncharacterized protein n=1 Tax=Mortierella isabellina TaxID=91625 RepID=A0A8H7PWQ1_MORIS|nr:hypothetical protein INT43_008868 [Umbelopsis isabellina]
MYIPIDKALYLTPSPNDDVGKDSFPVIMQVDDMTTCFGRGEILTPIPTHCSKYSVNTSRNNYIFNNFESQNECEVSTYRIGRGRNARPYQPKYGVASDAFRPVPHKHMPYPDDPMKGTTSTNDLPVTIPCNFYVRTNTGFATLIACRDLTTSPFELDDDMKHVTVDDVWLPTTIIKSK